jgi:hypothetical protein
MKLKTTTNHILMLSIGFLILTVGIGAFLYSFNNEKQVISGNETPEFFCGTVSPNYSENGLKGRQIFNANCAACHQKNRKMTGPALARIDSIILFNWLKDSKAKVDSAKYREYGKDFHLTTFQHSIEIEDVQQILEYCWTE